MSHLIAAPIVACFGALLVPTVDPPSTARAAQPGFQMARRVNTPIRHHEVRRRKVLIVAVGQSNNGLLIEPDGPDPVLDAPDARILELSRGILRNGYEVAPVGERHVFQHPAQDDRGGICMRLAGAKALLSSNPAIEEVTLFCGAMGGTSLAPGLGGWAVDGPLTQRAIDWCAPFMAANPDHEVIFWCSLGSTDAMLGMSASSYKDQLIQLADTLRTNIPGARDAFWVQADMPRDLVESIDGAIGNGTNILQAQNSVADYVPNSGAVTMFDLPTYDGRHIDAEGLRVLGARMGFASRL